jgi:hypothetical protein
LAALTALTALTAFTTFRHALGVVTGATDE